MPGIRLLGQEFDYPETWQGGSSLVLTIAVVVAGASYSLTEISDAKLQSLLNAYKGHVQSTQGQIEAQYEKKIEALKSLHEQQLAAVRSASNATTTKPIYKWQGKQIILEPTPSSSSSETKKYESLIEEINSSTSQIDNLKESIKHFDVKRARERF